MPRKKSQSAPAARTWTTASGKHIAPGFTWSIILRTNGLVKEAVCTYMWDRGQGCIDCGHLATIFKPVNSRQWYRVEFCEDPPSPLCQLAAYSTKDQAVCAVNAFAVWWADRELAREQMRKRLEEMEKSGCAYDEDVPDWMPLENRSSTAPAKPRTQAETAADDKSSQPKPKPKRPRPVAANAPRPANKAVKPSKSTLPQKPQPAQPSEPEYPSDEWIAAQLLAGQKPVWNPGTPTLWI